MRYSCNFADFYDALIRQDRSFDSAPIVTVSATDKDSGDAGTVEYGLLEPSSIFTLGRSDGDIRLSSSPDIGRVNYSHKSSEVIMIVRFLKKKNYFKFLIRNISLLIRRLLFCSYIGKPYVLRLRATDQGTPPLTSGTITVRIDVTDPENTMVDLELEISLEQFEANRELFLEKISQLLGAEVGISEITVITEESRRRKRETKTR